MSLFLIAGSIASTLCSCAATDSSAVVGYIDEHPITMEEFNYLSQQKAPYAKAILSFTESHLLTPPFGIMNMVILLRWIPQGPLPKKPVWKHTPHKCLPRRQLLLSSCRFPN